MMQYFTQAYFIYSDDSKELIDEIKNNPYNTQITALHIKDFLENFAALSERIKHMIVSIDEEIPDLLTIAYKHNLSIGFVPLLSYKEQIKNIYGYADIKKNLEIALRDDSQTIDILEINSHFIYAQGAIGTVPLLGENLKNVRNSFVKTFLYAVKKFFSLELQKFEITTDNGQKITTAGSGIVVLNHTKSGFLSRIFNIPQSMRDGKITIVIISPYSVVAYIRAVA